MPRNKKARTRRASWVFRRLSETGLDSYLVGRGHLNWNVKGQCLLGFILFVNVRDTAGDTSRWLLSLF